ncbi:type I-E CRISPR-associated protein Cas5/CasD [Kitasatospora sp. NPDC092948]|uniref:type I-E CRISPR-associated protein Cas5/CasD n=1 Tax=Kitasatospora sp. NPDC092948 TaxID=3364088 RepID=UPI0037F19D17
MSTLLLVLAGPMQSWGGPTSTGRRDTLPMPTKSAVVGLLGAAQGLARTDTEGLARLADLRFGVRTDQPGILMRDFHTAPGRNRTRTVSDRYYLADAVFTAAVESDREHISGIARALRNPVYAPCLGRRSCVPSRPVLLDVRHDLTLEEALEAAPWQAAPWYQHRHGRPDTLPVHTDTRPGQHPTHHGDDHPVDFHHHRHRARPVTATAVPLPREPDLPTHDPFAVFLDDLPGTTG